MLRSTANKGTFSGGRRTALGCSRRREGAAVVRVLRFRNKCRHNDRRQGCQRRQGGTEVMRRQTQLTGVRGQPAPIVRRMLDGMRPRRQLGEQEDGDENEMAQRIHELSLIDLDEQTFEIFAFGKIQGHRMIGRPGQPAHDTGLATGIVCRPGDNLLKQFQPDTA